MLNLNIEQLGDSSYVINGIHYVKAPDVLAVCVKHIGNIKTFLFECEGAELWCSLKSGIYVVCDTMYGERVCVVHEVIHLQQRDIPSTGAYTPLKKVLRIATQEEIIKAYENINGTTPF